jgi:hypothetical protein
MSFTVTGIEYDLSGKKFNGLSEARTALVFKVLPRNRVAGKGSTARLFDKSSRKKYRFKQVLGKTRA